MDALKSRARRFIAFRFICAASRGCTRTASAPSPARRSQRPPASSPRSFAKTSRISARSARADLGYDVTDLFKKISEELGTSRLQPVILVGVGHLGLALVSYRGFEKEGFEIVAAFDADPSRKRDKEIKQPIYGMDELPGFVQKQNVKMAILTVPAAVAQAVANHLIEAGVTGILNFSPIVLSVPEEVMVNNVNLAIELENLSYFTQE
jgi:redox-sensing transcriptional repressor